MTTDRTDLPYAGLTITGIADALTALGVRIGPGVDNPEGTLHAEHVPEFLGVLACLVNGYTGMVTEAGISGHERAMWIKGYLAGAAGADAPTANPAFTTFATIGTSLLAEAEVIRAAAPASAHAKFAADAAKLAATLTLLAGAIDDEAAEEHADITTAKLRGMLAEVRTQITHIRGALGPVERQLRRRGFDV